MEWTIFWENDRRLPTSTYFSNCGMFIYEQRLFI